MFNHYITESPMALKLRAIKRTQKNTVLKKPTSSKNLFKSPSCGNLESLEKLSDSFSRLNTGLYIIYE